MSANWPRPWPICRKSQPEGKGLAASRQPGEGSSEVQHLDESLDVKRLRDLDSRVRARPSMQTKRPDRSSWSLLTRWRQRMGEEKLQALLQESLSVATRTEALEPSDLNRIIVDTTVQPKNVMFPTDARLLNRAREILVRLAKRYGVKLRQSYARVGKFALIKHQRYAHAKQFKRANRALKKLKAYLGRIIRDIGRKLGGNSNLLGGIVLERMLALARQVRDQSQRQRGPKVYSLHAPEVECIGKGKAHRPYEFGLKVSVATTLSHAKGGQFVTHVKALSGNPYDGHTLATVIPEMEALIGNTIERVLLDKGYRGHNAPLAPPTPRVP